MRLTRGRSESPIHLDRFMDLTIRLPFAATPRGVFVEPRRRTPHDRTLLRAHRDQGAEFQRTTARSRPKPGKICNRISFCLDFSRLTLSRGSVNRPLATLGHGGRFNTEYRIQQGLPRGSISYSSRWKKPWPSPASNTSSPPARGCA